MRCFPSDSASPRCRNCHKQEICLTEVILYKVPMYFSSPPSFLDSSYHVTPESDIITVLRVLSTLQINVPYWLWQLHQHIYLQTQYTNTVLVMRAWEVWGFVTLVSTISIMMAMAVIVEIGESWEIISTFITCKKIYGDFRLNVKCQEMDMWEFADNYNRLGKVHKWISIYKKMCLCWCG